MRERVFSFIRYKQASEHTHGEKKLAHFVCFVPGMLQRNFAGDTRLGKKNPRLWKIIMNRFRKVIKRRRKEENMRLAEDKNAGCQTKCKRMKSSESDR